MKNKIEETGKMFNSGLKSQPFSYYGGKQRMASKILPLIPKHVVYVEPFCGGASVFWRKPWPEVSNKVHYIEVLNDFNGDLVNFFRVLQDRELFEDLQHKLQFTPYSQEEYRKAKQILRNEIESTLVDKAWAWFIQTNMSFSGKLFGGWGTSIFSRNISATWANKLNLKTFCERLISTHISQEDAVSCLKRWNSPQTFAYIDPPYINTACGHYAGYTEDQYKELIGFLDKCFQGSFILSGYPNEFVPEKWEKISFDTTCSAKGRGRTAGLDGSVQPDKTKKADESTQNRKRTEVLWIRSNTVPVREEIQKLFNSGKFDCFTGDDR